jgi:hypothetical protein
MAWGSAFSVGLPVLECMLDTHGRALADGSPLPKCFGVFFWGNGVRLSHYVPTTVGPYELTETLKPLANVKDYVSVISGYDIKTGNERPHHAGAVGILTGVPMVQQAPPGAPFASTFGAASIDQVIANRVGAQTRFKSIELGISPSVSTVEGTTLRYLSHNGPDNPNPPEYSPEAFYARVFGMGFKNPRDAGPLDPRLALRKSVLSIVGNEATALRNRVSKSDQIRLDQHFESIRALEKQIVATEQAAPPPSSCGVPGDIHDTPGDEHLSATMGITSGLMALALACDQTRVFSILFSGSVGSTSYPEIEIPSTHHNLTHDEAGDQPQVQHITVFVMQRLTSLLESLKLIPEGDGTLLDRCIVLATSDCAEGQTHSIDNYPILIAGGGRGSLVHPGIHIQGVHANTSDVLLTLQQAMDIPVTEFGQAGGKTTTTVSALRAA